MLTANRVLAEAHRTLVERVLREQVALHEICRVVGIGMPWLMPCMGTCINAAPDHSVQYTLNLSNFNGVEMVEIFNHTASLSSYSKPEARCVTTGVLV